MKKQTKRVLGFCGLAVVGITTAIAATLPAPTTAATDGESSQTDTVVVRVVSDTPDVNIGGITSGATIINPEQTFNVDYSDGVDTVKVVLTYTDIYGNTDTYDFGTKDVDFTGGVWSIPVDLTTLVGEGGLHFNYGHYKLTAVGTGFSGVTDTDVLEFDYAAATMTDGGVDENGNVIADIESDGKFAMEIVPYDKDENIIDCARVSLARGTTRATLPFGDCGLPSGTYKLVLNSLDANGNIISSYAITIDYTAPEVVVVPDTGNITMGLNISRTDYLITGLVVFGMIALTGIVMVVRRKKHNK